ncbi:MAG: DUF4185 domain-containing protein [Candidatus Sericytochromatia bacterium]|nr:DUF4185 domain-containing protein [Candidatus Tanganyikabacteria bacterium]
MRVASGLLAAAWLAASGLPAAAPTQVATDLGPVFHEAAGRIPGLPGEVLGVDAAYSVPVGGGRTLWVFGDTLMGGWTPDGSRSLAAMPANSAALVRDGEWRSGFPGARWVPAAPILGASGATRRRWPLDVVRIGRAFWLYYVEIEPTGGSGLLAFSVVGTGVTRLGRDWRATAATPLWDGQAPTYGTSAMVWKGALYVFAGGAATFLARVRPDQLGRPAGYAYWAGGDWTPEATRAAKLPESGPEMSVRWNPHLREFLMVYIPPLGREIRMRTAAVPWGPWSEAQTVAPCQPAGDPGMSCYGAKQHVELDRDHGREIVLTYNTNTEPAKLAGRPDLYWPRLVRVRMDLRRPYRSSSSW